MKVEALANIWEVDVKKFVWRNIVTRFGVPESLVLNNGLQFDSRAFREYCSNLGIVNRYSTPAYPQSNSQAEASNKAIVNGLKRRLKVLRAGGQRSCLKFCGQTEHPRRSTRETPFSLTYGAEAVILAEINLCSAHVTGFNPAQNSELLLKQLNLLEERWESTTIRLAKYQ